MAKGKHAAALFEVIHSSKRSEPAAGALRTPKWWFKSRPAIRSVEAPAEQAPAVDYADAYPPSRVQAPPPAKESRPSRGGFDQVRKEITMRMRFSTVVVGGFAVVLLLGMAYVLGRHASEGPQTAVASDAVDSNHQKVDARVMDVPHRTTRVSPNSVSNNPAVRRNDQVKPHELIAPPATANIRENEPAVELTGPRVIGRNYIIIKTYPADRKDDAQKSSDYLSQHGIPCSIERAPHFIHGGQGWIAVISFKGFDHITDPACQAYVKKIEMVGQNSGKARQDFSSLMLYKWQ